MGDPFEPPLSAENAAFVAESGKFVAVDVTHEPFYSQLANQALTEAIEISIPGGNIVGARLHIGGALLRVIVEGDAIVVAFEALSA